MENNNNKIQDIKSESATISITIFCITTPKGYKLPSYDNYVQRTNIYSFANSGSLTFPSCCDLVMMGLLASLNDPEG